MAERRGDGEFRARLSEFLLIAYAAGDELAGEYHLPNSDESIPNLSVRISRASSGPAGLRPASERPVEPTDGREFRVKLEEFLLTEYARGVRLAGTWHVRFPWGDLPEWTVGIETDGTGTNRPRNQRVTGKTRT